MFLGGESKGTGLAAGSVADSLAEPPPVKQAFTGCCVKRLLSFPLLQGELLGFLSLSWGSGGKAAALGAPADCLGEEGLLSWVPKASSGPHHHVPHQKYQPALGSPDCIGLTAS